MFIDIHGHLSPQGEKGGGPPALRDPEGVIARKRALGIDLTIIGTPCGPGVMLPLPDVDNFRHGADAVRAHNELMGSLVDTYPDSLRSYVYLDPFGDDAMLDQARELLFDWRFVGLVVNTSVNDEYLSSPKAEQFFAMAAETGVPVLLHPPARPVGAASFGGFGQVEHVGRFNDVTAGLAAILWAGWLERFPDLVLIAAAGGGAISLLGEKLDLALAPRPGAQASVPTMWPSAALGRLYVDTSCPSPQQLAANVSALGAEHVLFGTDAPPVIEVLEPITDMVHNSGLAGNELEQIGWRNANRLFDLSPALAPAP